MHSTQSISNIEHPTPNFHVTAFRRPPDFNIGYRGLGIGYLLVASAVFFFSGIPLYYFFRKSEPADFKSAMVTAALGWLLISLVGCIPFWLIPYDTSTFARMDFLSAFLSWEQILLLWFRYPNPDLYPLLRFQYPQASFFQDFQ